MTETDGRVMAAVEAEGHATLRDGGAVAGAATHVALDRQQLGCEDCELMRFLVVMGIALAILAGVTGCGDAPDTTDTADTPRITVKERLLREARRSLAGSLRKFSLAQPTVVLKAEPCFTTIVPDQRACILRKALRPYEGLATRVQRDIKLFRARSRPGSCRRSLQRLEEELIRIGLLPRVITFGLIAEPATAPQALETWIKADGFWKEARRKTRAACGI